MEGEGKSQPSPLNNVLFIYLNISLAPKEHTSFLDAPRVIENGKFKSLSHHRHELYFALPLPFLKSPSSR